MCSLINSDVINDSLYSTHGNISPWLALFNEKLSNDRGLNMPGRGEENMISRAMRCAQLCSAYCP